jgi:hypothetical protein
MTDDDERGAVGGMRIGSGNRSTKRKPAPVPLSPPQIPHDLTWARARLLTAGTAHVVFLNPSKKILEHLEWATAASFSVLQFIIHEASYYPTL